MTLHMQSGWAKNGLKDLFDYSSRCLLLAIKQPSTSRNTHPSLPAVVWSTSICHMAGAWPLPRAGAIFASTCYTAVGSARLPDKGHFHALQHELLPDLQVLRGEIWSSNLSQHVDFSE